MLENIKKLVKTDGVESALATCIAPLVEAAIEKIDSGIQSRSKKINFDKAIKEYMINGYEYYLYMNTIVFGNAKKTLFELYQPLTIKKIEFAQPKTEEEYVIDGGIDFILEYKNTLIEDTAGMGKSTIVKYLAIACLVSNDILPFVIELRNLKDSRVVDYIKEHIQNLSEELEEKHVAQFLEKGEFIFLFDGYDEVEEKYKSQVAEQINIFMNRLPRSYFVITSRKEDGLNAFGNFQKFGINGLTKKEAYELLKRYDNDGDLSKILIEKLKSDEDFKNTKELLQNPLLVSLLYKTFEYGGEIPYKKTDFYALIFDALFDKHDKAKGHEFKHEKKSGLDSTEFNRMLRMVAYLCMKEDTIEYDKDRLKTIIGQCLDTMKWLKCSVDNFYNDITHAVPFFQEYNHKVKWTHKSFQEYFAANYIYLDKENKKDILTYLAKNASKYYNILDFYYDLDIRNFRKFIIGPMLNLFITQCNNEYIDDYYRKLSKDEKGLRTCITLLWEMRLLKDTKIGKGGEHTGVWNKELDKKWKLDWRDIDSIIADSSNGIYIISKDKAGSIFNNQILKLLNNKKIDIFFERKNLKDCGLEINDGLYTMNDDINNCINHEKLFTKVNKYICSSIQSVTPEHSDVGVVSYRKAIKIYKDIQKESEVDNEIFDL